jgi:glycosyltransferase involved in cell wall biosynthesis
MSNRDVLLADPLDAEVARRSFAAYEAAPDPHSPDHLKYLQLKCLHEPVPTQWLNEVGRRFQERGRRPSAFLCFIQSLWLDSRQPDIFALCESLKPAMSPPSFAADAPTGCAVSVIMPTYNRGAAIRESLVSILRQTWRDFEVLVVNDGGDEVVEAVIRQLDDPRIRYTRLEPNQGKAAARNAGIRAARGRYLAFLDDDDVYFPDHLESLVRVLAQGQYKVAYAGTRAVLGHREGISFVREEELFVWNEAFDRDKLLSKIFLTSCTMMLDRAVLARTGLFIDLHFSQDWDLWLRCAREYLFFHVSKVTSEYRLWGQNTTLADRVGAHLLGHLVTRYHILYCGQAAYAKYFAEAGELPEARRHYDRILAGRPAYFRHPSQLAALAALAKAVGDRAGTRGVTREYVEDHPRECLRLALTPGSPLSRSIVLLLLPFRIVRSLTYRASRLIRRWA